LLATAAGCFLGYKERRGQRQDKIERHISSHGLTAYHVGTLIVETLYYLPQAHSVLPSRQQVVGFVATTIVKDMWR
jgi:hypothetical protein